MKVNGVYFKQTNKHTQVTKEHKSIPHYSNLKLKPQVQTDIVVFKGKENVLSQEQKALDNLNALLKQNVINPELNTFLIKEVNSKNKNVIKYLNEIKASKDPNLKGHKAVAERLVSNHAQISGAIASMKSVDDETKQKLDFENQLRMVHGINEIYTKDKDVKTEETNGEIGFGMNLRQKRFIKGQAIVQITAAEAGTTAALLAQIPEADVLPLIGLEAKMAAELYGIYKEPFLDLSAAAAAAGATGNIIGANIFKGILGIIPGLGNALNASIAVATVEGLGEAILGYLDEKHKND